ncbi:class II aldolase/adducin family protein [Jeotgalibacillus proteolyticus]|uniref:class II aldolase/adducin family protein n=1 Tax=Jeotgalibacillus proteolyticus TaxID=2082395 RepID=UPI001FD6A883|nr:class II aldolase/adducin family protein [Jeotgalibacillus proteolyticus]
MNSIEEINATVLKDLTYGSKTLFLEGHNDINNGQISYRITENTILIRRAFLGWEETTENDFILIDLEGNRLVGEGAIPSEWPLHTEIYKSRKDVNCLIHSHPPYSMLFGATNLELKPVTHDATPVMNTKKFDLTTNTVTNQKIGSKVADSFSVGNTLFLKNHGIVAVGKSIPETICWAIVLENACKFQLMAESFNTPYTFTEGAEVKVKSKIIFGKTAIEEYWKYWCRRVDHYFSNGGIPYVK